MNPTSLCVAAKDLFFCHSSPKGNRELDPNGVMKAVVQLQSLQIDRQSKWVVTGPSGSGKTTLLNLLAAIIKPTQGQLKVVGIEISTLSAAQRRTFRAKNIGMIFQEFELLEHLSVLENILLPTLINRELKPDSTAEQHAHELASRSGIIKLLRRKPRQLSQGERQRVAICRALVTRAPLILADEPTGNLDPKTSRDVLDIMFDEIRQQQATLIMVTHDHSLLDRFDHALDLGESTHLQEKGERP